MIKNEFISFNQLDLIIWKYTKFWFEKITENYHFSKNSYTVLIKKKDIL